VAETANQTCETAANLLRLFREDGEKIRALGHASGTAALVHIHMQANPISSIGAIAAGIMKTVPAATLALDKLQKLGIVREITGRKRSKIFVYTASLALVGAGTEPLQ
jgi:hypothetical protein